MWRGRTGCALQENSFYTKETDLIIPSIPLTLLCFCSPDDKEVRLMDFAAAEKMKIVPIFLPVHSLPVIHMLGSNTNFRVH